MRLQLCLAPGALALVAAILWAVQPATGFTLDLADWRPLDVPPEVWVCLATGFVAYLVSTWIWVLKPDLAATRLFALSGVMTLLFTFADTDGFMALQAPDWLTGIFDDANMLGASGFGIVMICLFLIYPGRLPLWRWTTGATVAVFGLWTLLRTFGPFRHPASVQVITFSEMIGIVLAVAWQIWAARNDLRQRSIAVWLGVCVLFGAGIFIGLVAVPVTFGHEPLVTSQYAFPSFLLIYAGLAVGLIRYRLFELGGWAFHLMFHVCVALMIFAVDAALIGSLSLAPGTAFGLALLATAFVYMPARDFAWRRLTGGTAPDNAAIFRSVVGVALKPSGPQRAESWKELVQDLYQPLELASASGLVVLPAIAEEGLSLLLPPVADSPALVLRYPSNGRALFTQRDLALAEQIMALMAHAEESRGAYDRGVAEERTRIARDIHDNIGAQLLRALHSGAAERKDAMIRDTLADLRDVINNAQHQDLPLTLVLADLRAETADRLSPHGVTLTWRVEAATDAGLAPSRMHALRSLVREATSNTVKYARATAMTVAITIDDEGLTLRIDDDGCGFNDAAVSLGHGLENMKARAESLGGTFALASGPSGTCLTASLPFPVREIPS